MKKYVVVRKNRESCRRQRQLGAAENRVAGLTARQSDVGLTSTWFEAALLDVNGSPDLPDISMNVTVTAVFFIFSVNIAEDLYLKRGVARVSYSILARHWLRRLPPATRHYCYCVMRGSYRHGL